MRRNLYRIDDVLLRAGGIALLLVSAVSLGVLLSGVAASPERGLEAGLSALAGHAAPLALAACCPAALLAAGTQLRRRERRVLALWSLLRQNAVISVPELLASSSFAREDLERAVHLLNDRGLAHYVWDRKGDTIQDGRLLASHLYIEKCDACGASVALEIPLTAREVPRCPFCGDWVCVSSFEERREQAIEALRAEARPEPQPASHSRSPFSLGLFVLLLIFCWPAAIAYALYEHRGG